MFYLNSLERVCENSPVLFSWDGCTETYKFVNILLKILWFMFCKGLCFIIVMITILLFRAFESWLCVPPPLTVHACTHQWCCDCLFESWFYVLFFSPFLFFFFFLQSNSLYIFMLSAFMSCNELLVLKRFSDISCVSFAVLLVKIFKQVPMFGKSALQFSFLSPAWYYFHFSSEICRLVLLSLFYISL